MSSIQPGLDPTLFSKPFLILGDCLVHSPQQLFYLHQCPQAPFPTPPLLPEDFLFPENKEKSQFSPIHFQVHLLIHYTFLFSASLKRKTSQSSSSKCLPHQLCSFSWIVIIFLFTSFSPLSPNMYSILKENRTKPPHLPLGQLPCFFPFTIKPLEQYPKPTVPRLITSSLFLNQPPFPLKHNPTADYTP